MPLLEPAAREVEGPGLVVEAQRRANHERRVVLRQRGVEGLAHAQVHDAVRVQVLRISVQVLLEDLPGGCPIDLPHPTALRVGDLAFEPDGRAAVADGHVHVPLAANQQRDNRVARDLATAELVGALELHRVGRGPAGDQERPGQVLLE